MPGDMELLRKCDSAGRLNSTLMGLNALGSTAWRVNNPVLRVALHEHQNGAMDVNGAPVPPKDTFLPSASDSKRLADGQFPLQLQPFGKPTALHSQSNTNHVLEIARQFAGLTFFLPHSVDFRGRAYPIPAVLTHLGNDLARGRTTATPLATSLLFCAICVLTA
jgi:DNA-directed RNA polymerase, mitochondrial